MQLTIAALVVLIVACACVGPDPIISRETPVPTPTPPWRETWVGVNQDGVAALLNENAEVGGKARSAVLVLRCNQTLRSAEARIGFRFWNVTDATAADNRLDSIHLNWRAKGTAGRWMKSGWKHGPTDQGYLVLWQTPAAAFVDQLTAVDELGVMVVDNFGEAESAVFPVDHLSAALVSSDLGWNC